MSARISELTNDTSPTKDDHVPTVDDGGTNKKLTLENLLKIINGLTADSSPDKAADYVVTYDTSASGVKKVLLSALASSTLTPVSPAVVLGSNADDLEWVGSSTFDFTTYSACFWVLNAKCTAYWQLSGLIDGMTSGYYDSQFRHLNGGGSGEEHNNESSWKIDSTGYMAGGQTYVTGYGYFWKNAVSGQIQGRYTILIAQTGRIEGEIWMSGSSKLDKFRISSVRNGFGALFNPWETGSTLYVYGVKKT